MKERLRRWANWNAFTVGYVLAMVTVILTLQIVQALQ